MADTALANMTGASALGGTEILYGNQAGGDVKITATQLKTLAVGAGSVSVASGKTATVSNTITFAGTDATTMTFPGASASVGYLGYPVNSKSADYTTLLTDAGKAILHAAADNNARTFTIDSNANVAYPTGTVLTFINLKNTLTISITDDTMTLANTASTTGNRTLAVNGIATAVKVGSTSWLISGTGLT